jgi:catechol 2,3-dioxygenase-like lactoylglutathione lyase family enzyme
VYRSFHVRLIVADFEGSFRFYRDLLGLKVTWGEQADGTAAAYASFEVPQGTLSINDQAIFGPVVGLEQRKPGEAAEGRAALIFEVESVDEAVERFRARGASLLTEPTDYAGWGIRAAHLRDPDGNIIEINELLPEQAWTDDLRDEMSRFGVA